MAQPGVAVASKSEVCMSWKGHCCEMVPRLLPDVISKYEIQAAVALSMKGMEKTKLADHAD